jgi:hypothetical protein
MQVMKSSKILLLTLASVVSILLFGFTIKQLQAPERHIATVTQGCVFKTVMGEENSVGQSIFKTDEKLTESINKGLEFVAQAQSQNGGWGAGSHANQHIVDPHAVAADPATTSMVAMALLRSGNSLRHGSHSAQLKKALLYILNSVETASEKSPTITTETGTQIQIKLGQNIDVILAAQFLSNILDEIDYDAELQTRIKKALAVCVNKIQSNQDNDGSMTGAGWAGVLQSGLANSALESAQSKGVAVDQSAMNKSKEYQQKNFDAKTGETKTDMGAGVVLYSVTGSARASAKEARQAKEEIEKAKKAGKLSQQAPVSAETLREIGYSNDDATRYATSYEVYESAKTKAQDENVMNGFGSNGGEEFLSYLQTGEGLAINKDNSWSKWFENITGRLISIQNDNGSWNGHHCITSPVFCTATCLLILTVNNDIDKLGKQ